MGLVDQPIIGSQRRATRAQMLSYGRKRNAVLALGRPSSAILSSAELAEIVDSFIGRGAYYGIAADAAFAQSIHETAAYTFGGQVSKWQHNPAGLGATNDGAAGGGWATWAAGIDAYYIHLLAWCGDPRGAKDYRIAAVRQEAAKKGYATTWRSLGGRWAVPGLTYGDAIEQMWQEILQEPGGATMGLTITPKYTTVNIWQGRQGHKPEALVMHVAEGGKAGVDSWFHNPESEASAHYLVNKDGTIWQFVKEADTAWANGKTNQPNRADPLIAAWLDAGINPNRKTISIETEGFWYQDMTPEQLRSVGALAADIHRRYGWPTDGSRLFGHNEFDAVDRARCPSFSRAEWDAILAAVKGGTIVVEKKPIGGIDPGFPGALNEQGELVVNGVNFGGRADSVAKAVFTVYNAQEQRYYQIEWAGHQIGPWRDA
ncbi:MAG TPA: N-acetylmuramoyl-L-alanine amidase [Thermomicrobiales bacterium]|jgi:N-acetyl-anhydromuramyl-L-alanine amidase AmpD